MECIYWVTDSLGNYCYNGLMYIGRATISFIERNVASSFSEAIVIHVIASFLNNDQHVTEDNWFSSEKLVERLLTLNGKPSSVLFYNDNRGGVDNLNKKVHSFSFRRKCRRWPFRNVCNFLDIAVINGMYLTDKTSDSTKKTSHHMFLKNLGYQLIDEHKATFFVDKIEKHNSTRRDHPWIQI
jgi:hypothetical protein